MNVLWDVCPMPKVETTLAQLSGAKLFRKLDANSGFWQIPFANESKLLTTFITRFGRFCFNKLPFGISSAPEIFQSQMNEMLLGLFPILMTSSYMEKTLLNMNLECKPHSRRFNQLESHYVK